MLLQDHGVRLLTTLEVAGWLERTTDGAFRLTVRPFQIGSILVDSLQVRHEAPPVMRRLSLALERTTYLTIPAGTHAVCIERIDRGPSIRVMDLDVGGSVAAPASWSRPSCPAGLRRGRAAAAPASGRPGGPDPAEHHE